MRKIIDSIEETDEVEETATPSTTESTTTEPTTTQPATTQPATTQPSHSEPVHTHSFVAETTYTTEYTTFHHDAVTHEETTTTYTTETIHHEGETTWIRGYRCNDCGYFGTLAELSDHLDASGHFSCQSYTQEVTTPGWDETVQVPHTTTTTVVDKPAYDEQVATQVPHTTYRCECGATK